MTQQAAGIEGRAAFLLKKFHSISGIVPVGAFLLEHIWINAYATGGKEAYNKAVGSIQGLPFLIFLEVLFIWLPILYHGIWGVYVFYTGSSNTWDYPYAKNWLYYAQRITGVLAFAFLIYHFIDMRLNHVTTFEVVAAKLASPKVMFIYVVGIGVIVFHFANGLWNFLVKWGVTVGEKTQNISGYACMALGVVLYVIGLVSLFSFK